jgi:hypothetical protein
MAQAEGNRRDFNWKKLDFARKENEDVSSDSEIEDYKELAFQKKDGKYLFLYRRPAKPATVSIASDKM